jgi:citrate synthase
MSLVNFITAREASDVLKISMPTLYAYVSRGLIRSEKVPGRRERVYRLDDVQALRQRQAGKGEPHREFSLSWGGPLIDSGISLIADGRLFLRGRPVEDLARGLTLEETAALIWDCDPAKAFSCAPGWGPSVRAAALSAAGLAPLDRLLSVLPVLGATDEAAIGASADGLAATAGRLLRASAAVVAGAEPSTDPIHRVLARAWGLEGREDLIRAALVLCADHELNTSTFAVRVVASTGASLYLAAAAGLAALRGPRHGGAIGRCMRMLDEAVASGVPARVVVERLERAEDWPGFGHPLYPEGDPRARALLGAMAESGLDGEAFERCRACVEAVERLVGKRPDVYGALAVLAKALGLDAGTAIALFAVGRTSGWIGHALEEYRVGRSMRPRARYTGPLP